MVKKLKAPKLSKSPEVAMRFIDNVGGVFKQAASHPSTLALCNMTLSTAIMTIIMAFDSRIGADKLERLRREWEGLYNGSQGIAQAAVIVPVIPQVVGSLADVFAYMFRNVGVRY